MWQRLCSFSTGEQQCEKRQLSWVNNDDLIQYFSWNKKMFCILFCYPPATACTCGVKMKWPASPKLPSSFLFQLLLHFSDHCDTVYLVISNLYLDQCSSHNTFSVFPGTEKGHCQLKLVNFEAHENHISHETQGLSKKHLVVRRGKPFKVTLLFGRSWNRHTEILGLQVWLGIKDLFSAHM